MSVSVQLRPVTPEDERFLYELYRNTREEEMASWGWTAAQREAFLKMQYTAQSQSYGAMFPEADHHIIMVENRPVGRIWVDRRGPRFVLIDIALLSSVRRQGIGGQLLQALQAEASREGKPVRLQVFPNNPARRLYERLGFHCVGSDGVRLDMEFRDAETSPS
ncbi:MAG: GNAT family N-acetyltransferase [Acidobacteriia bacterium]|nr:GNAT family N-acetyltransferase [Terriglobia bacterium]